jgi:hypothetical protein
MGIVMDYLFPTNSSRLAAGDRHHPRLLHNSSSNPSAGPSKAHLRQ